MPAIQRHRSGPMTFHDDDGSSTNYIDHDDVDNIDRNQIIGIINKNSSNDNNNSIDGGRISSLLRSKSSDYSYDHHYETTTTTSSTTAARLSNKHRKKFKDSVESFQQFLLLSNNNSREQQDDVESNNNEDHQYYFDDPDDNKSTSKERKNFPKQLQNNNNSTNLLLIQQQTKSFLLSLLSSYPFRLPVVPNKQNNNPNTNKKYFSGWSFCLAILLACQVFVMLVINFRFVAFVSTNNNVTTTTFWIQQQLQEQNSNNTAMSRRRVQTKPEQHDQQNISNNNQSSAIMTSVSTNSHATNSNDGNHDANVVRNDDAGAGADDDDDYDDDEEYNDDDYTEDVLSNSNATTSGHNQQQPQPYTDPFHRNNTNIPLGPVCMFHISLFAPPKTTNNSNKTIQKPRQQHQKNCSHQDTHFLKTIILSQSSSLGWFDDHVDANGPQATTIDSCIERYQHWNDTCSGIVVNDNNNTKQYNSHYHNYYYDTSVQMYYNPQHPIMTPPQQRTTTHTKTTTESSSSSSSSSSDTTKDSTHHCRFRFLLTPSSISATIDDHRRQRQRNKCIQLLRQTIRARKQQQRAPQQQPNISRLKTVYTVDDWFDDEFLYGPPPTTWWNCRERRRYWIDYCNPHHSNSNNNGDDDNSNTDDDDSDDDDMKNYSNTVIVVVEMDYTGPGLPSNIKHDGSWELIDTDGAIVHIMPLQQAQQHTYNDVLLDTTTLVPDKVASTDDTNNNDINHNKFYSCYILTRKPSYPNTGPIPFCYPSIHIVSSTHSVLNHYHDPYITLLWQLLEEHPNITLSSSSSSSSSSRTAYYSSTVSTTKHNHPATRCRTFQQYNDDFQTNHTSVRTSRSMSYYRYFYGMSVSQTSSTTSEQHDDDEKQQQHPRNHHRHRHRHRHSVLLLNPCTDIHEIMELDTLLNRPKSIFIYIVQDITDRLYWMYYNEIYRRQIATSRERRINDQNIEYNSTITPTSFHVGKRNKKSKEQTKLRKNKKTNVETGTVTTPPIEFNPNEFHKEILAAFRTYRNDRYATVGYIAANETTTAIPSSRKQLSNYYTNDIDSLELLYYTTKNTKTNHIHVIAAEQMVQNLSYVWLDLMSYIGTTITTASNGGNSQSNKNLLFTSSNYIDTYLTSTMHTLLLLLLSSSSVSTMKAASTKHHTNSLTVDNKSINQHPIEGNSEIVQSILLLLLVLHHDHQSLDYDDDNDDNNNNDDDYDNIRTTILALQLMMWNKKSNITTSSDSSSSHTIDIPAIAKAIVKSTSRIVHANDETKQQVQYWWNECEFVQNRSRHYNSHNSHHHNHHRDTAIQPYLLYQCNNHHGKGAISS